MSDSFKYYVPQTLDDPPKFLFWDFDVALLFLTCFGVGIMMGQMLISVSVGWLAAWRYTRAKSGQTRGYGVGLIYWHLPINTGFKRIPDSSRRHFIG